MSELEKYLGKCILTPEEEFKNLYPLKEKPTLKNINDSNINLNDLIYFQINRNIVGLYKEFLKILEENKDSSARMEETLDRAGFEINKLSDINHKKHRKLVLDKSNDCLRELKELLNKVNIRPN